MGGAEGRVHDLAMALVDLSCRDIRVAESKDRRQEYVPCAWMSPGPIERYAKWLNEVLFR